MTERKKYYIWLWQFGQWNKPVQKGHTSKALSFETKQERIKTINQRDIWIRAWTEHSHTHRTRTTNLRKISKSTEFNTHTHKQTKSIYKPGTGLNFNRIGTWKNQYHQTGLQHQHGRLIRHGKYVGFRLWSGKWTQHSNLQFILIAISSHFTRLHMAKMWSISYLVCLWEEIRHHTKIDCTF